MKFGIGLGIKNNIWVGNINKKRDIFLNKEDKTLEVLSVVMELVRANNKNNETTELQSDTERFILSLETIKKDTNDRLAEKN